MLRDYRVFAHTSDLTHIGQVDVADQLHFTLAFNGAGVWDLQLPAGHPQCDLLSAGNRVSVYHPDVITPLFSGPITQVGVDASDKAQQPIFKVSGVDENSAMWDRYCLPTPNVEPEAQSVDANYIASGAAETVLKQLVAVNAGSVALPHRRVPGLQVAPDSGRGATIHLSLRFDVLGDVLNANAGGLGWQITADGTLLFDMYVPRDLSQDVRFSRELGNLETYQWTVTAATVTEALVAGQGVGVARQFVEREASVDTFNRRREAFVDRRDTNDIPTLEQAGDDAIASGAQQNSITIGPVDTSVTQFGRDYYLGDVVTVEVDGQTFTDVVRQVDVTVTKDGAAAAPVIGGSNAGDEQTNPLIVQAVTRLAADVRALKARQ